ncbi:MAG TPA: SDR family NAD(P)-dependent oxidoreductase, partial [Mycobacterium sp.]|nr:SDR family NAD(P)-dependent oxidoreductase [Mycobacterium sp.]
MYCIDLSGKRAVVVGGTSGIGRATAELLASAGAEVITLSRRAQPAITTSDEVRARISHRVLDVADPAAVKRVFAEIAAEGGVDISIHSAAVVIPAAAVDTDDDLWRHHMTINVDGVFY